MATQQTIRARQLLADQTLPPQQRLTPELSAQLLRQLRLNVAHDPEKIAAVVADVDDPDIQAQLREALA